jgi:hypothetical protein
MRKTFKCLIKREVRPEHSVILREAKCSDIVSHIQELAKESIKVYAMCSSHIPATVCLYPIRTGMK